MTISEQQRDAFKEFEKTTWNRQAEHYDAFAGQMTHHAIDRLLNAVQVSSRTKLLDVATGPGYVAAKATTRGADAIGVDITENMVAEARRRFPGTTFEIGDAETSRSVPARRVRARLAHHRLSEHHASPDQVSKCDQMGNGGSIAATGDRMLDRS